MVADKDIQFLKSPITKQEAIQIAQKFGGENSLGYVPVNKSGDTMTGNLVFKSVEATLAGTYTITENLGQKFCLDPNGANRDVLLPPNPTIGLEVSIRNKGTGGFNLIVKNSAGTLVTRGTVVNNLELVFTFWSGGWVV